MSSYNNKLVFDKEDNKYMHGDNVCLKHNGGIIHVTVSGSPKWRNWTKDGSYNYIYTVIMPDKTVRYVEQDDIVE